MSRGTGRTTRMLQRVAELPTAIVVGHSHAFNQRMKRMLADMGADPSKYRFITRDEAYRGQALRGIGDTPVFYDHYQPPVRMVD